MSLMLSGRLGVSDSVILLDFGASRVKCVLWSYTNGCVIASEECTSPNARYGSAGQVELDPEDYWDALLQTAGELLNHAPDVKDIWLCTEMHGFMLVDSDIARPLTPYISWQDQRASYTEKGMQTTLESLKSRAENFLHHTGMQVRSGLPGINLIDMACKGSLPNAARFATLSDWLIMRGGERVPKCHLTQAAGTGLFSIVERKWMPTLLANTEIDLSGIQFPKISSLSEPIGHIRIGKHTLRVWGGIGDMQAAAHGGMFPQCADIIVNLGTGSQVMARVTQSISGVDRRPGITEKEFFAVTHIPSGRALNVFASFLDETAAIGGGNRFFWKLFTELAAKDVLDAAPVVDLNVFDSAWKYDGGGLVRGIHEHQFTPHNLILAIARSWLQQYAEALSVITQQNTSKTFLLTGGLSRRASFIPVVLEELLQRRCIMPKLNTGEETLDGLLNLAKKQRNKD